jgi:hypothetical protein
MNVRYLLLALSLSALAALGIPALTHAQTPDRIASLDISVWPEFDDPRVLVQYDGQLAAKDGYPRDVSFYVPSGAAVTATAYEDDTQKLLNTDPATIADAGNGLKRVTFKLPKPHFHLEYYNDMIKGAPDKSFEFAYTPLLPADQINVQVQQPLKADKFTTVPPAAQVQEGMHGFKYYLFSYQTVAAEQPVKVQVSYVKTDPNPSLQNVTPPQTSPQTSTQTTPTAAEAQPTDPQQLYLIVGLGAIAALGVLAVWMWYRSRVPHLALALAGGDAGSKSRR